jgi:hypothetical protein
MKFPLDRNEMEAAGAHHASVDQITLLAALVALEDTPGLPGSTDHDEILPGVRTLHVPTRRQ